MTMFQVKSSLKLPSSFNSNPTEATRNPEDVLDYVPGECWARLLTMASEDDVASYEKLLSVLVRTPFVIFTRLDIALISKNIVSNFITFNYKALFLFISKKH